MLIRIIRCTLVLRTPNIVSAHSTESEIEKKSVKSSKSEKFHVHQILTKHETVKCDAHTNARLSHFLRFNASKVMTPQKVCNRIVPKHITAETMKKS